MAGEQLRLDGARLKRGGFGNLILLILSSWIGLIVGTVLLRVPMLAGFLAVPVFGIVMGHVGMSRARNRVISATNTRILPEDHELTRVVHGLARELSLPAMPLVGVYPDDDLNAFAAGSGPHKAVVSFSQGLLDRCSNREVLAIAVHELAHIANNDMRRLQFAWSFQNALTWYMLFERARAFVRWILGTVGELMIMRLSRSREYWADATAAALLGPEPMIEALRRIDGDPVQPSAKNLAYARLMIRPNPRQWFATHPTTAERIARLEEGTYTQRLPYRPAIEERR